MLDRGTQIYVVTAGRVCRGKGKVGDEGVDDIWVINKQWYGWKGQPLSVWTVLVCVLCQTKRERRGERYLAVC